MSQVRRWRLISFQVPVLPSRDEFVAIGVVDSSVERDIVLSSEVGSFLCLIA